jgi:AraC-like DNA-binding protein
MRLHIKYMVSLCCKKMVRDELDKLKIHHGAIELGEVELKKDITASQRAKLKAVLAKSGFELMDDPKAILIEQIKNLVIEMIHDSDTAPKLKYSVYIGKKLKYDYTYLANIFSETTGTTIESYIIAHKVEKIKELLLYDELTLTQISYQLDYSSVAHLSNQFKKVTGLTPTYFKQLKHKKRIPIENL